MATKEDILEQIVEEYLIHKGYFVQHNIKFRPREAHPDFVKEEDSSYSDIDVLAYNPKLRGPKRVLAVSCKSWQNGFGANYWITAINQGKKLSGREAWKFFRELCKPKWSEAFIQAIEAATGSKQFSHVLAVARIRDRDDKSTWENYAPFKEAIGGNPLRIITFEEMVTDIREGLSTTLAATEVGRLLQMFRAARIDFH